MSRNKCRPFIQSGIWFALFTFFVLPTTGHSEEARIQITSPAPGAAFAPGSIISVTVNVTGSHALSSVCVLGEGMGTDCKLVGAPEYNFTLVVPSSLIGQKTITAFGGLMATGNISSAPVTVDIEPSAPLVRRKIDPPLGYMVALRAEVDNGRGATLAVTDPSSPIAGTSVTFPPGSLAMEREQVILSYSDKLPAQPRTDPAVSLKRNSYVFALQTESGHLTKQIRLLLPFFERAPFYYWDPELKAYQSAACASSGSSDLKFAECLTKEVYPRPYVSLNTVFLVPMGHDPKPPAGWKLTANADKCLVPSPSSIEDFLAGKVQTLSLRNRCDFDIQASACVVAQTSRCQLSSVVALPSHGPQTIELTNNGEVDPMINISACPLRLTDGTAVKLDLELSSQESVTTACLVPADALEREQGR